MTPSARARAICSKAFDNEASQQRAADLVDYICQHIDAALADQTRQHQLQLATLAESALTAFILLNRVTKLLAECGELDEAVEVELAVKPLGQALTHLAARGDTVRQILTDLSDLLAYAQRDEDAARPGSDLWKLLNRIIQNLSEYDHPD